MSEAIDLLDRYRSLAARRDQWKSLWQQLAEIFLPHASNITMALSPGHEHKELYDTTPMQARRGLATAIDGLLKPATSKWFWMVAEDEDLNDQDEAKRWFEDVQTRMWDAIYDPRARFIEMSGSVDSDLATFGLGHLWIGPNKALNGLTFKSLFIGDVAYDENADGLIDTYTISQKYTARQAYQLFGQKAGPKVMEDLAKPSRGSSPPLFEFVQCIYPRHDRDVRKADNLNMAWADKIVSVADQTIVEESGHPELPIATPRWELTPGQIYPRSPAMIALPDARTLQAMGHTLLVGGQRAVDPPTWIADDGVLSAVRTYPGGLTVVDAGVVRDTNGRPIGTLDVGANIPIGREMQADYRAMVEAAFFKNVFNLPTEGPQMTAYEVAERKQEFLRTIGPVMGQLESSYIGTTVERVFSIMLRSDEFPPMPDVLKGRSISFKFMSPIQQARKQIEAAGLSQTFQFIAPILQLQPDAADHIDGDAIVRDLPDMFSTPQRWLRPQDEVDALRDAKVQAMQMAATMGGAEQAANTGKTLADANKSLAQADAA